MFTKEELDGTALLGERHLDAAPGSRSKDAGRRKAEPEGDLFDLLAKVQWLFDNRIEDDEGGGIA